MSDDYGFYHYGPGDARLSSQTEEGNVGTASVEYGPGGSRGPKRGKSNRTIVIVVVALTVLMALLLGVGGFVIGRILPNKNIEDGGDRLPATSNNFIIYHAPEEEEVDPAEKTTAYVADKSADTVVEVFVKNSSVSGTVSAGIGSGVIFSKDEAYTYIITNNHVVEGQTNLYIRTSGGVEYRALVVGTDWVSDIAVLRIEAVGLPLAVCDVENPLKLGEDIVVIGNPLGALGGSVAKGVVSGLSRTIRVEGVPMTLLQIDAAVNPGNSGGGLFDMDGNLVGIVNAKSVGVDVDGIGFAIPIETAIEVATELLKEGYIAERADLGLVFSEVTSQGLRISEYAYNDTLSTPLKSGDILRSIGGVTVSTLEDYRGVLTTLKAGDTVEVTVRRYQYNMSWPIYSGYEEITVTMTVHEYAPN